MIFSDVKEQEITSIGTLLAWFCSSGSQKKEYLEDGFECEDVVDVVFLDREAISFFSSALGFQKKERSVMGFICGVTGDAMIFAGEMV